MTSRTSSSKKPSPSKTEDAERPESPDILVVDDDPGVRSLLVKALTGGGYRVRAASDGLEALKELEAARPDLLIVDVMIPELDGVALVKAIRAHKHTSGIPVIFITAKSDPQSMIAGINVGARYYVTKPFRVDDVLAKVERILASRSGR